MSIAVAIRQVERTDRGAWARLRHALWPEENLAAHASAIDRVLASEDEWAFLAIDENGKAVAFAEIAVRKYANGCESQPVPFLEGIWVDARFRRCGIGRRLVVHVEQFVAARGFREIGSDALIDNVGSHTAHAAWGFAETERVVYFHKLLG